MGRPPACPRSRGKRVWRLRVVVRLQARRLHAVDDDGRLAVRPQRVHLLQLCRPPVRPTSVLERPLDAERVSDKPAWHAARWREPSECPPQRSVLGAIEHTSLRSGKVDRRLDERAARLRHVGEELCSRRTLDCRFSRRLSWTLLLARLWAQPLAAEATAPQRDFVPGPSQQNQQTAAAGLGLPS